MVKRIKRLPAGACRYYADGRCLIEEFVNPGYHEQWRCLLLSRLEVEYDRLLTQADNFRLEHETTARIWGGRVRGLDPGRICVDFAPGGKDVTGCRSCRAGICVKRLPPCKGVCRKFAPGDDKEDDEHGPDGA
jgi:hypothetical protein